MNEAPITVPDLMDRLKSWFGGESWEAWRTVAAALFGLPMSEELALYRKCTGRQLPPSGPATEEWLVVGRRGGKSMFAAVLALYFAVFRSYRLALGEKGIVMVLASDRRQARVVFRYVRPSLIVCRVSRRWSPGRRKKSWSCRMGL